MCHCDERSEDTCICDTGADEQSPTIESWSLPPLCARRKERGMFSRDLRRQSPYNLRKSARICVRRKPTDGFALGLPNPCPAAGLQHSRGPPYPRSRTSRICPA
jgi:hypothetical protein